MGRRYKITKEIIESAQRGDNNAQTTIYNAYKNRLMKWNNITNSEYNSMMNYFFNRIQYIKTEKMGNIYFYLKTAAENTRKISLRHKYRKTAIQAINFADMPMVYDDGEKLFDPPNKNREDIIKDNEKKLADKIYHLVENLNIKESWKKMYYLYYREGYTLKQVGDMFGYTNERIRQITNEVTKKIKKNLHKIEF